MSCLLNIITINYNDAQGLEETISSIEQQTQKSCFQHIIIDGASSDYSVNLLEAYSKRNRNVTWISEPDTGIYDAMNKGLHLMDGQFVAFLNSGDVLYDDTFLELYIDVLARHANTDFFYNDLQMINNERVIRHWRAGKFKVWKLYLGWMPPHPMTAVSSRLIRAESRFDTRLSIAADYDFMLARLLKPDIKVYYTGLTAVKMLAGGVSNGSLLAILRSNIEVLQSWQKYSVLGIPPVWVLFMKPLSKVLQSIQ